MVMGVGCQALLIHLPHNPYPKAQKMLQKGVSEDKEICRETESAMCDWEAVPMTSRQHGCLIRPVQ